MRGTMPLAGRVVLVTGAASGLECATALDLTAAGTHVAIGDIDAVGSEETRRVTADLFDRQGDAFDVLVNVAGIDRPGYIIDIDLPDYRRVQAVNCEGPVFLTSEFLKRVQRLPDGRCADDVHGVSLSAITSGSGAIAYHGSKAAFRQATTCVQRELREKATALPDGTEKPFPCRASSRLPWTRR